MEQGPTPEQVREALIINELKDTTPEELMDMMRIENFKPRDTEKIKEFISWGREWESLISSIEDQDEGTHQQIKFEIQRAQFYLDAGLTSMGKDALEDALRIAEYAELEEIAREILEKLSMLD